MSRKTAVWLFAAAFLVLAAILLSGNRDFAATSSSLSRGAGGWLAARLYLEARGARTRLLKAPLSEPTDPGTHAGVLVLAFPWQQPVTGEELEALGRHLRAGGTILLAYSGEPLRFRETRVYSALGLETADVRPPPPLGPQSWWAYQQQTWRLRRAREGLDLTLTAAAFRQAPAAPAGARVLYRGGDDDDPLVFEFPLHRGRVVAVPAGLFANAWLGEADNADFLESLLGWLGPDWVFDEFHHGLATAETAGESTSAFAWDLFVAHLALIYLLGLFTLGRRFGPAWREPPEATGSTSAFLRQLGALHHRLGHHRQAAALLVEHARAFDPGLRLDEPSSVGGGKRLVELARRISRASVSPRQQRRNP